MPSALQSKNTPDAQALHTTKNLELWFKQLKKKDPKMYGQISEFGIHNAGELAVFLKSPLGKAIETLIAEQIMQAETEQRTMDVQQKKAHTRRLLFLLLVILEIDQEKDAAAKKLVEGLKNNLEQLLKLEAKKYDKSSKEDGLRQEYFVVYSEIMDMIESELKSTSVAASDIESHIDELQESILNAHERYQYLDESLNFDFNFDFLDDNIRDIEAEVQSSYAKIIPTLSQSESSSKNVVTEPFVLNLKIEMLRQIKNARQKDHLLFDQYGKETTSFRDADFYVPKHLKLTYEEGKYYLHDANKAFKNLSPLSKEEAHAAYHVESNDLMSVKMRLKQQKEQELNLYTGQREALNAKMQLLSERSKQLTTQLTQLQNRMMQFNPSNKPEPASRNTPKAMQPQPTGPQSSLTTANQKLMQTNEHRMTKALKDAITLKQNIDLHRATAEPKPADSKSPHLWPPRPKPY